jgi:hypothetical protein
LPDPSPTLGNTPARDIHLKSPHDHL